MHLINYISVLILMVSSSCTQTKLIKTEPPEWTKTAAIYEIMPKQFTPQHNLKGITQELARLRNQYVSAISILPIFTTLDINNAYNPGDPYACSEFLTIDPALGTDHDFITLIDSAHHFNIKVLLEFNLTYTTPNHPWRKEYPEFYKSSQAKNDTAFNQDYIRFNLENKTLQKKLIHILEHWMKDFPLDGFVLMNADQFPESFLNLLGSKINSKKFYLVSGSNTPEFVESGYFDSYFNYDLYHLFIKMIDNTCTSQDFKSLMEINEKATFKNASILFNQNALLNNKDGTETQRFYGFYKLCSVLSILSGGIPMIMNGQEEPMFDRINPYSNQAIVFNKFFSRDFFRSLFIHRVDNPAIQSLQDNLPVIISDATHVLAFERKHGEASIVVMANLTNQVQSFTLKNEYIQRLEFFTRALTNFEKNKSYTLNPYQYIVLTNIK